MTSSSERKKTKWNPTTSNARWWMRDLLEAAKLFVFAPTMRPCAKPYGFFARENCSPGEPRKSGNSSESESFHGKSPGSTLSVPESAWSSDDSPIILPTFHRMRVHPKKPISCSLNLGLLMGVWEMGHQDGEKIIFKDALSTQKNP